MRYSMKIFYLKSPESSDGEVFVEVSNRGQIVSITEVHMRVGTKQAAHLAPHKLVLQNNTCLVTIHDPHLNSEHPLSIRNYTPTL